MGQLEQSIGGTFRVANQDTAHRLVVGVDGLEKSGKTHLALSAPGPLAYQAFDIGHEGVIQKVQDEKKVYLAQYEAVVKKGQTAEAVAVANTPIWEQFVSDYELFIEKAKALQVRTGIIDTASEVWEVLRLARLGKLTQVMPHHYTALNTEYRNLVRQIYGTTANLILLHKLKAEWAENAMGKSNKTGNYERAGYAETGFLVQCNVLCWREEKKGDKKGFPSGPFHVTIKDCRQNPKVAGVDLVEPYCSFAHLGVTVYPDSEFSDWE